MMMKIIYRLILFLFLHIGVSIFVSGQINTGLQTADSFYMAQHWAAAKKEYLNFLRNDSTNSVAWNRLGFCNQNIGLYQEAIHDYNKSMENNPSVPVKNVVMIRISMTYSLMNKAEESTDWLMKSTIAGYNSLKDIDSLDAFKNLRASSNFNDIRKKVYEIIYPCSKEPRNHDFDFWIGDWNCYRTGTQILSGYSHVESMAGGCAILENYTAVQAYSGKSFNFYDTISGRWEQDWIGSGGPVDRQRYYNGVFKDGNMHFMYETTNSNGEKVKGNFIFYFINKDSVRQYQDIIDKSGKTVSVTYDLMYLRKN